MGDKNDTQNQNVKKEIFDWVKSIAIAIFLAFIIRSFIFAPFVVEGTSMMPTLIDGERLIVNEIIYNLSEASRGDIIVFHYNQDQDYIKRIIGLPGDTVEVRDDQLYINNEKVDEPYLTEEKKSWQEQGLSLTEDFGPVKVDEHSLFVMGDNRRNSKDSRMIGEIDQEQVVGRADLGFWPLNTFRILGDDLEVGE